MELIILIPISIYICLTDIRFHRIPNVALCALLILFIATSSPTISKQQAFLWLITSSVLYVFGIGMGDIKLLTLLAIFHAHQLFTTRYLLIAVFSAALFAAYRSLMQKTFRASVPLAPSIFLALIFTFNS
jgi:Flp pilus assembly protein protease CpaA